MREWRTRAFVRPFVITLVGVGLSLVLATVALVIDPCTYGPGICGMVAIGRAFKILLILAVGLFVTGLIVSMWNRDRNRVVRATTTAVVTASVGLVTAEFLVSLWADRVNTNLVVELVAIGVVWIGLLIPTLIGVAVGGLVGRRFDPPA